MSTILSLGILHNCKLLTDYVHTTQPSCKIYRYTWLQDSEVNRSSATPTLQIQHICHPVVNNEQQ